MVSRRYSGYLADDESLRGPQMRNPNISQRRDTYDWRSLLRQPSHHHFWNQDTSASRSTSPAFTSGQRRQRKHRKSGSSLGESSHLANEFSEFVDFLADEDVLDSLQGIMEDAVRKLRDVTTEDGERIFDIQEDSHSSTDSESWSFSYSSTHSRSKRHTTTTSSSEEDWERRAESKREPKPEGKMCLLDKYAARLPKLERKTVDEVSGGFHAETFSERSGDSYFFRQEHFHIWAKLAESFEQFQPPKKDYFAKFSKEPPKQSFSIESLQKEITNVLKRPTPSSIPLYYPGNQPFRALDFLEENKILAALQDIINQAVQKVLEATGTDGVPLLNLFDEQGHPVTLWESSLGGSDDGEEGKQDGGSGSVGSGSGEETSEDGDSKSEGSKSTDGKKKRKRKGKKKKKRKAESPMGEEKGKSKYTPPPLPKSKRKSPTSEDAQRKPKYVAPPLPKTKPRPPPEVPTPKQKYVPPPLPKPKQKKKDSVQMEAEAPKQPVLTKHIITPKDIKRARLQARPLPKQSVLDFLIENAAKLILYKYNYETLLSAKLGLISVPVTKVLLEIMFGYKKIKGSGIRLSSQIDWTKVYDEIYATRPPKPKPPRHKPKDKKKAGDKKWKPGDMQKRPGEKKKVLFKPEMPGGKVVVMRTHAEKDLETRKIEGVEAATEQEDKQGPEIFEIVPPQFPREGGTGELSADEEDEGSAIQPSRSALGESNAPPVDSPMKSVASEDSSVKLSGAPQDSGGPSPASSPKKSMSSRKSSAVQDSDRGSQPLLPEVEPAGQSSSEFVKKVTSSRKSSFGGEGSKTVFPKISN